MSSETSWELDPSHLTVQFSVRHMMVTTVRGQFEKATGTIVIDDTDVSRSRVDVTIDASSIDTREAKRDAHLKSADFFDVEKYPTITFRSTKVERAGKDELHVTGDLTMRGVTHPIRLEVEGPTPPLKTPWGGVSRGASATAKIHRKDWGLNWNVALEAGGILVGEEVKLSIDVELLPKKA